MRRAPTVTLAVVALALASGLLGCGAATSTTAVSRTGPPISATQAGVTTTAAPSDPSTTTTEAAGLPLYRIMANNKYGYMDRDGAVVIQPQYDDAGQFSEGLARVGVGGIDSMKWGYIDTTGAVVIQPRFSAAWDFSEDVALVVVGDSYFYLDRTGATVLQPKCTYANPFSDGRALIVVDPQGTNQYAYIDHTGATVISARFWWALPFSEGLAAVAEFAGEGVPPEWGYIDPGGAYVIQPRFYQATAFSDGLAVVSETLGGDRTLSYIDKTGTVRAHWPAASGSEEPYGEGDPAFSEGLAAFYDPAKRLWGYLGNTGKVAIEPRFVYAGRFSEGLAVAATTSGPVGPICGYIDASGTFALPAIYAHAEPFSGDLAWVVVRNQDGSAQRQYIDKSGKVIWAHAVP